MMRKTNLMHVVSGAMLFGGLMVVGCADNNYDLGNLNKTIAIGSDEGFALPGNNTTTDMQLKDFFDELIDTTGVIKINSVTGDYYFTRSSEEGEISDAWPMVDEVEMTITSETEKSFDYDMSDMVDTDYGTKGAASPARHAPSNLTAPNHPEEVFHFEFESLEQVAEVLNVSLAELRAGIDIRLTPSDGLRELWDNILQISIKLPEYLLLEFSKDEKPLLSESNVLKLTHEMLGDERIELHVKLNGVNFNDFQEPDPETGWQLKYANDNTSFIVGGVIMDVWYNQVAAHATRAAASATAGNDLFLKCTSVIEDKIKLTSATGYFAPTIDLKKGKPESEPVGKFNINRSSLPDFLLDKDVRLNVNNPEIRVKIGSNMALKGFVTKAVMSAMLPKGYENVKNPYIEIETRDENGRPFLNIDKHEGELDESTESTLILCDVLPSAEKRKNDERQHIYYAQPAIDSQTGQRPKLSDLLNIIPESIAFDCKVEVDSTTEAFVRLGRNEDTNQPWYHIAPSYEVYAPLAFNEGSSIVYNDSITGWNKDLEDITLSENSEIVFTTDVVSRVPLDLNFHAFAIDSIANNLSEDLIKVVVSDVNDGDVVIKSGETTRIKITITQVSKEAFKVLDGLRFVATAFVASGSAMEGVTLNQNQTLKLDNISILLKGKVIIDLN